MSTQAAPPPPTEDALEAAAAREQQPDGDALAELEAANQQLSFAQKPVVQNVLPFVTSVAVHMGILLIAWVLWDNREAIGRVIEEQIIVPEAAIVDGADVGGIPNPGLGGDPTRAAAQDITGDAIASDSWADRKSDTLQANLMAGGESEQTSDTLIGLGASGAPSDVQSPGQGGGASDGTSQIAPFGVPGGGGGIGPKASFVGISGNARRVIYVCDATGSMLNLKFALLHKELYKAIDILKPIQGFNVIFWSDEERTSSMADELLVANPANKLRARKFIEDSQVFGKDNNPLPALRQAFSQKPELIYFLTDGKFDYVYSYEEVIREVARLNPDKSAKLNCIFLISSRTEDERFEGDSEKAATAMQKLARENGGRFVKVSDRDLE